MSKELKIRNGFELLRVSDLDKDSCVYVETSDMDDWIAVKINKSELKQLKDHIDYLLSK